MGVLKSLKCKKSAQITVKIPTKLYRKIDEVREKLKEKGFTIDISEGAANGIKRMLGAAEKELAAIEDSNAETEKKSTGTKTEQSKKQTQDDKPPRPPAPPSQRQSSKSSSTTSKASASP